MRLRRIMLIFLSTFMFNGCSTPVAMFGSIGNKESESINITKPLPKGFIKTVNNLEEYFQKRWDLFDQENKGKDFYYGIIRGNAFGEFKAAIEQETQNVNVIFLYKQDLSGYGISSRKANSYKIENDEMKLSTIQKGQDSWGNTTVSIVAKTSDNRKFVSGVFDADHGALGKYSGKFYGIYLGNKKVFPIATINDNSLIKSVVSAANYNMKGEPM